MNDKTILRALFGFILVSLVSYNLWASTQQPLSQWAGLTTRPDNWCTIATFIDAYYGFVTFYVWVLYKESPLAIPSHLVRRHHGARQHRDVGLRAPTAGATAR